MQYNIINQEMEAIPLDEVTDLEILRNCVRALFGLLDDIDTASDMFKPSDLKGYKDYYRYAMIKAEERGTHVTSNGYVLFVCREASGGQ